MNDQDSPCHSCTMPIESGDYCDHCANDQGELRQFAEVFERFVQFAMGRDAALDRASAEANTLAFMRERPAWRDHPDVAAPQ